MLAVMVTDSPTLTVVLDAVMVPSTWAWAAPAKRLAASRAAHGMRVVMGWSLRCFVPLHQPWQRTTQRDCAPLAAVQHTIQADLPQ